MQKTWFIIGSSPAPRAASAHIWAEAALKRGDRVTTTARKLAET